MYLNQIIFCSTTKRYAFTIIYASTQKYEKTSENILLTNIAYYYTKNNLSYVCMVNSKTIITFILNIRHKLPRSDASPKKTW